MEFLTVLLWILALLAVTAGIVGLVVPMIPGPPLVFLGLLFAAWAEDFHYIGTSTLVILALMALLGYLADYIAAALGANRAGASRRASIGAAIGAIIGIFFGFIGVFILPFIGAFIGELSVRKDAVPAARAGFGVWLGLLVGIAAKAAIAFALIGLYLLMRFFQ